jgi:DNA-binding NarL/FixJ family response regulator
MNSPQPIRTLIYDDNEDRLNALQALFSLYDTVECVGAFPDCSAVEEQITVLEPDIVLMDISMPGISGIEATRRIVQMRPGTRVVMQTLYDGDEMLFNSLQAGASGYLLKSSPVERIMQCIMDVHNGGSYMSPSVARKVMQFFSQGGAGDKLGEYQLTKREKEVLTLLVEGHSYKMISDKLEISYFTANAHIKKIYEKLHVNSMSEAVSVAIRQHLV